MRSQKKLLKTVSNSNNAAGSFTPVTKGVGTSFLFVHKSYNYSTGSSVYWLGYHLPILDFLWRDLDFLLEHQPTGATNKLAFLTLSYM